MNEGVFYDMPDAEYRKAPGVSNSQLKHIALNGDDVGSPAHFKVNLNRAVEDTKALFFGRMVHTRILTPDAPLPSVVLQPESYLAATKDPTKLEEKPWHNGSNFCKDWTKEQLSAGLRIVTKDELADMNGVVNSVAGNEIAKMALREGNAEVSLFKSYYISGRNPILRKARLDWIPAGPSLVDIKTTQDARKDEFEKSFYKFRYFVQAAYYLDLWNELNPKDQKTNFVFIAVEKKAPFAVNVFDVAPRALEAGRAEYRRNLHLLMHCIETDSWPAYGDDVKALDLPAYAYKKGLEDFV